MTTPNIGLTELSNSAGQYLNANEAFAVIDALLQTRAISKSLTAAPGSPSDGDVYIMASAWAGITTTGGAACAAGDIALYRAGFGAFKAIRPKEGWKIEVAADDQVYRFDGATWVAFGGGGMTNPMTTAGDLIVGASGGTPARLGMGSALQVLRVNAAGTALEYAAPSGGGMSPSDIKTAYESNPDTNAFTDAEQAKLTGIEAGAQANVGTNLTATHGAATVVVASSTGDDATILAATSSTAGAMTGADRVKLDGVATGATANSSDATLLNRANHTGTQAASTISDFASSTRAQVEAELVAGANVTITPSGSGATRQLTIAAAGGGGALPTVRAITADETLGLAHINTFGVNSTTSNYTSTIPAQSSVAWTADAEIHFLPSNTGNIVVTAGAGVSLNGVVASSVTLSTQNGAASIKRLAADSWWIGGATGGQGGITVGTAIATTSGTSHDFTGIPSWVKRVTVMLSGVSTNGASNVQLQLGTVSGVETSGYTGSSSYITGTNSCGNTTITSGVGTVFALNTSVRVGSVVFTNVSGDTWCATGVLSDATNDDTVHLAIVKSLSGTLDRIRLTTVNGTDVFDAGSVNILYEG